MILCDGFFLCDVFRSASLPGNQPLLLARESMPLIKLDPSLSSLRNITIPVTLCPNLVSSAKSYRYDGVSFKNTEK